jgi:hypothetical protein
MLLSFTRQNINAIVYGMAGCRQLVGLDSSFLLITTPPTANFGFGIPNAPSYLGLVMYAQGATFSAGFNALGVIASNGGEIRVGL